MITQRAVLVGIVGFCFYLIALVNGLPSSFYVLTWLSVSVLVASGGVALLSLTGLVCRWRVVQKNAAEVIPESAETAVHESSGPVLEVELTNRGTLNKTGAVIEVRLLHVERGFSLRRRFFVEALPSGTVLSSTLTLPHLTRGRYQIQDVRFVASDVLGLFRTYRRVPMPLDAVPESDVSIAQRSEIAKFVNRLLRREKESKPDRRTVELLIGPASVDWNRRNTAGQTLAAGNEMATTDLMGRSDEMRGTRPYVAGDDLRTVHWKSTARLGRLVVREFDRSARPECLVIWDGSTAFGTTTSASSILRTNISGPSRKKVSVQPLEGVEDTAVEQGLRLAASLCRALTQQGRPCALLRLDSAPLWVPSQRQGSAPAAQLARCLEALAPADAARTAPLAKSLGIWSKKIAAGGEAFLVTAAPSDDIRQTV
ncbi:MAG TPA: DUF58 domain-containing protein, partial [Abditibacteriaceae bacterium]